MCRSPGGTNKTQSRGNPFVWLSLLLLFVPLAVSAAEKERRIALVIGISAYQNAAPLANPVADARAIGDSLRRLDFDVTEIYDADYRTLAHGISDFGLRASGAEVAIIYYAGHGIQSNLENYLIPADAKLERERDLLWQAIPVENALGEAAQASKIGILLLDSCRNNPFSERVSRSVQQASRSTTSAVGMARIDNLPRNTLVAMAAKAGQIAEDGHEHSPFAAAILAHLQIPGLELGLFFRSVRDTVLKATQNRQEPYVFSSLGAEPFYFYPRPPNRPPEIGAIHPLEVTDSAGPTPLGMPRPVHPNGEPMTVRITGLPRSGDILINGHVVTLNTIVSVERFMSALYKPDGKALGSVGNLAVQVEDGHGSVVAASLPISVRSSKADTAAIVPGVAYGSADASPGQSKDLSPGRREALAARMLAEVPASAGDIKEHIRRYVTEPRYRALAISSEMYGSWRVFSRPTSAVAEEHALEGCQAMYGIPCALFAHDDQVVPIPPGGVRPPVDMPRVRYAGAFDPAQIPVLSDARRSSPVVTDYATAKPSKAMAFHPRGQVFSVTNVPSQALANDQALAACNDDPDRRGQDGPCYLYAVGDQVVLPFSRIQSAAAQVGVSFDIVQYAKLHDKKAIAIHVDSARKFYWDGVQTQGEADQLALEGCQQQYAGPCVLLASDAELRAPNPRMAQARDMPRLHYRGKYNPDNLPFLLMDSALRRYSDLPGFKAIAVRPYHARVKIISGAASVAEAERRALADCNADHADWPCFLYASGEQVVLPDRRTEPSK